MNDSMNECVIEWIKGDKIAGVTMPNNTRLKTRILKIAAERDEVEVTVNKDGSIYARIPSEWIKINPKRIPSEEEMKHLREMALKRKAKLSANCPPTDD